MVMFLPAPAPPAPAAEAIALLAAPEFPPPPRALRGACFVLKVNHHQVTNTELVLENNKNHLIFTFDATVLAAPPSPLVRTIFELKTPTNDKRAITLTSIVRCNIGLKTHRRNTSQQHGQIS